MKENTINQGEIVDILNNSTVLITCNREKGFQEGTTSSEPPSEDSVPFTEDGFNNNSNEENTFENLDKNNRPDIDKGFWGRYKEF